MYYFWLFIAVTFAPVPVAAQLVVNQPPGPQAGAACGGGNSVIGYTSYGAPLVCGTALASGSIANGTNQLASYIGINALGPLTPSGDVSFSAPNFTVSSLRGGNIAIPNVIDTVALLAAPQAFMGKTINCASNTCTVRANLDLTGTLQAAQFPALVGAVQTTAGSLTTVIRSSGVVPGNYTNLNATIGVDGRITLAANGTVASPGGSAGFIQFNNTGSFGGYAVGGGLTTAGQILNIAPSGVTSAMLMMGVASSNIGALSQDLSGSLPAAMVSGINGTPLGSTAPAAGNLMIADGTQWVSQPLTGDVSLTFNGVATTKIASGSVSANDLSPGAASANIGTVGGDLVGSVTAPKVIALQGRGISANAPNVGDSYVWNGTAWVPAPPPQSGINQLTGAVMAGPGTGMQTASIAPTGVAAGRYQVGSDCWTVAATGQIANIAASTTCAAPVLLTGNGVQLTGNGVNLTE